VASLKLKEVMGGPKADGGKSGPRLPHVVLKGRVITSKSAAAILDIDGTTIVVAKNTSTVTSSGIIVEIVDVSERAVRIELKYQKTTLGRLDLQ